MCPFASEKQRRLFHAAKKDPAVRKRYGISKGAAKRMTDHDTRGKLREYVRKGD